ncbi:MAG: hypothetical protein ACRCUT_07255, partial [Spirochaetota bacterium]
MKKYLILAGSSAFAAAVIVIIALLLSGKKEDIPVSGDPAEKWARILEPSVLEYDARVRELRWFKDAARDLGHVTIVSTGENIEAHYWESRVLAAALSALGRAPPQPIKGAESGQV